MSPRKTLLLLPLVYLTLAAPAVTGQQRSGQIERRAPRVGERSSVPCVVGTVWREAFRGDYVCVPPESRSVATRENADPASAEPCQPGTVWREADPADHVCVSPARRGAVAAENRRAATGVGAPPPTRPPAPSPGQPTGVQVAFGEEFKPTYDWIESSMRFMTNVPCSGTLEIGTRKPVETHGVSKATGATRVAHFNDTHNNAHLVFLSTKSLPKATVYYWVITINANGTTDQLLGEIYPPVSFDAR